MKRAFIIIATGSPTYGEMALNLCLAIKANGNHNVFLIHTDSAVHTLGNRIERFDSLIHFVPEYYNRLHSVEHNYINPATQAFYAKLYAYYLLFFREGGIFDLDEVIILDADTMILPDKNLGAWFDHELPFAAYYNDAFDFKTSQYKTKNYHFWCNPLEIKEHFKIADDAVMPQINASFIYFRKSDTAKAIFDKALEVWNEDFPTLLYRGSKTEEVCFNIACAILNYRPFQVPYRPLYMQCYSESKDETYIQHRFKAISMAGSIQHDQRIVSMYNRLSDYYRGHFGIKDQFHFKQEHKLAKEPRKIFGYWHIAMMGDWVKVVKEQLRLMKSSGLIDATECIYAGVVGDYNHLMKLSDIFQKSGYTKIIIAYVGPVDRYEFPTLDILKGRADQIKPHFGWYIHTKGVSDPRGKHWRDFLNHFNIEKWKECQHKLRQGFDLCGVKLIQPGAHPMHYSGNFWHFDSDYVKSLKPIDSLDQTNRFNAEMWICSNRPNAATLNQTMIDHYNKAKFKPSLLDKIKELWKKF